MNITLRSRLGGLVSGLAAVTLSACSMFSLTPTPDLKQMVADAAPEGAPIDTAEAQISKHNFGCSDSHGSFIDDNGQEHSPKQFVTCTEKPARFSFVCQYRNYVYLIPKQGMVDEVYVVRGPNCTNE